MALLEAEELTYFYPGGERPALDRLSVALEEGELTLLTGPCGGGKTTLARALAGIIPAFFGGRIGGTVRLRGQPLAKMDSRALHREIGFVFQEPERQLLMTTAGRELAFGPENLGMPPEQIEMRVAATAASLGIIGLLESRTAELSGGMQQRVVLGGAIAMEPRVLVLDEPTSQLDPVSARELLGLLTLLRDDFGCSVILVEQRPASCLPIADRVIFLRSGRICFDGRAESFAAWAARHEPLFLPASRGLRRMSSHAPAARPVSDAAVLITGISFAYPGGAEALRHVNLAANPGEVFAVLGPNGAGKSTLLKVIAGLVVPGRGGARLMGDDPARLPAREKVLRCGYLSQNADDCFLHDCVLDEITYIIRAAGRSGAEPEKVLAHWEISHLAGRNPRELGAGERECVALAAAAAADAPVLLLDEPTRGLDPLFRERVGRRLSDLARDKGVCVILATQDVDFACDWADRVALMAEGEIVIEGPPQELLGEGPFSPLLATDFPGGIAGRSSAAGGIPEVAGGERRAEEDPGE